MPSSRLAALRGFLTRHALYVFYIVGALMTACQLTIVNFYFWREVKPDWLAENTLMNLLSVALNALADGALLMLPVLLLPRRVKWLQWILIWLVTIWCVCQLLYHPSYLEVMPFSSFVLFQNVSGILINSALGNLSRGHLPVVIFPVLLYVAYRLWLRRAMVADAPAKARRWAWPVLTFYLAVRLVNPVCLLPENNDSDDYWQNIKMNYTYVQHHREQYFKSNGLVAFTVYSAVEWVNDLRGITDQDKARIKAFAKANNSYQDNTYASHRTNLVLIIVESFNSWAVNMKIDGREVSPTLNRLCNDTVNNIVGLHMKRQAKNGNSSDGYFLYNTGMLPLSDVVVATMYGEADYPSLAKALGSRYHTAQVTTDALPFWNLVHTSKSYGVQTVYCKDSLEHYSKQFNWLQDKAIFTYCRDVFPKLEEPYFMQIVTQTMHSPYNSTTVPPTWISQSRAYTPEVRNYLEKVAFFDRELEGFLQFLKDNSMYDNSLIVIASDHSDVVDMSPQGRPSINKDGDDCALIILNSGRGMNQRGVFGQIDVYPTILDLMGANRYWWKGFGNSLLRNTVESAATSPEEVKGNSHSALAPRQRQAWELSRKMIVGRYIPAI